MYSDWASPALYGAGLLLLWLLGLTFWYWQLNKFLKSLFPKSGERDVRRKFEEVLKQVSNFRQDSENLIGDLSKIKEEDLTHIQRVELLRYNPYGDTGGDQSFSLALLDKEGNGIVLTSLHARSGTRVFAKPIQKRKGIKYRLSEEEEKVVERAMNE